MAKRSKILKGLPLLATVVMLTASCKSQREIPYNIGDATARTSEIAGAIWAYGQDNEDMTPLFGKEEIGVVQADRLIEILALKSSNEILKMTNADHVQYLNWPYKSYLDPWGNPYFVAWQIDPNAPSIRDHLTVLVWSPGQNGINEFGQGDDVFSMNGIPMAWPKPRTLIKIERKVK